MECVAHGHPSPLLNRLIPALPGRPRRVWRSPGQCAPSLARATMALFILCRCFFTTVRDGSRLVDDEGTQLLVPFLVIPGNTGLPPVLCWRGTIPKAAEASRPRRHCRPSPVQPRNRLLPTGPNAGTQLAISCRAAGPTGAKECWWLVNPVQHRLLCPSTIRG